MKEKPHEEQTIAVTGAKHAGQRWGSANSYGEAGHIVARSGESLIVPSLSGDFVVPWRKP
jgi:hypothetical protein